jgi:hypothetical protein
MGFPTFGFGREAADVPEGDCKRSRGSAAASENPPLADFCLPTLGLLTLLS